MVLGMHDALVSLTGLIAGLAFALADRYSIIMSGIIASVAASLSMTASNYLAEKTNENPTALTAGLYTGLAYMLTCVALIIPFFIIPDRLWALMMTFAVAIFIIFAFNWFAGRINGHPWARRAFEMLGVCAGVSVAAFIIGQAAKYFLGLDI